jgi:hypothetical protein
MPVKFAAACSVLTQRSPVKSWNASIRRLATWLSREYTSARSLAWRAASGRSASVSSIAGGSRAASRHRPTSSSPVDWVKKAKR